MDAARSPGSTFKVLAAFAPALDSAGQTLATVYNDAPFNYDDGTPVSNWYKTGYRGINSIRTAHPGFHEYHCRKDTDCHYPSAWL